MKKLKNLNEKHHVFCNLLCVSLASCYMCTVYTNAFSISSVGKLSSGINVDFHLCDTLSLTQLY